MPTSVIAFSSMVRNGMKRAATRLRADSDQDHFPSLLRRAFERITNHVREGVAFDFANHGGELDVVALVGDTLVVLEVKHSLLPTGPHELRTSWDYVCHAAEQLDRFSGLFNDHAFREYLEPKLGFAVHNISRLQTGIVLTNRMFMGYRVGRHSVRGAFDLVRFLEEGVIRLGDEARCFWGGERLTADDLVAFFDRDITLEPFWRAMEIKEQEFALGSLTVTCPSFRLIYLALAEALGFQGTAKQIEEIEKQPVPPDPRELICGLAATHGTSSRGRQRLSRRDRRKSERSRRSHRRRRSR